MDGVPQGRPPLLTAETASVVRVSPACVLGVFRIGAQRPAASRKCLSRGDNGFRRNAFLDPVHYCAEHVELVESRPAAAILTPCRTVAKTSMESAMVTRSGFAGSSGMGTAGEAVPSHAPACSHASAMALASSHSHRPGPWRRERPADVPEANMGHSHRFQPLSGSSNPPERSSSGCAALQSRRWRRQRLSTMATCATDCPILPGGVKELSQGIGSKLAVRVGFEPTEPAKVQRFSRPPDSTALAPHRIFILPDFPITCGKCHQPVFCFKTRAVTVLAPFLAINPTARLSASRFVWA